MRVHTLSYSPAGGWSAPLPAVDPTRTLIGCFGSAEYLDESDPIAISPDVLRPARSMAPR